MIIGCLSELRYQMQTDKAMAVIRCGLDVEQWNAVFEVYRKELGTEPSWFSVSWLFAECFMYRKIADVIQRRHVLSPYLPRIMVLFLVGLPAPF